MVYKETVSLVILKTAILSFGIKKALMKAKNTPKEDKFARTLTFGFDRKGELVKVGAKL